MAARLRAQFTKPQALPIGWHGPAPNDTGTSNLGAKTDSTFAQARSLCQQPQTAGGAIQEIQTAKATGRYLALTDEVL